MSEWLEKLGDKSITKEDLLRQIKQDFSLVPTVIDGLSSSKATIRYGCGKVLVDLSGTNPDRLYKYMDAFVRLLRSRHRILVWNGTAIIANLARVDTERKFDAIFGEYFALLNDEYLVTVANTVANSAKIALAKPYLIQKIADELLATDNLATTPHLTEECKRVIAEKAIDSFSLFFDKIEDQEKVIAFVSQYRNSPRKTLKKKADEFLSRFGQE
jgi:hypothetical protein